MKGYHRVLYEYDSAGTQVMTMYLKADDSVIAPAGQEYAYTRQEYSADRRVCTTTYYGTDRKPMIITGGYCATRVTQNSRKKTIREEYLDAEGRLTLCDKGYAVILKDWNTRGKQIMEA